MPTPKNQKQEMLQQAIRNYFSRIGLVWRGSVEHATFNAAARDLNRIQSLLKNADEADRLEYVLTVFDLGTRVWLGNLSESDVSALAVGDQARIVRRVAKVLSARGMVKTHLSRPLKHGQSSRLRILGTYRCGRESQISLDLSVGPIDLIAVLLHELNHFFADRQDAFPELTSPLHAAETVLTEEAASSLTGALFQNHIREQIRRVRPASIVDALSSSRRDFTLADFTDLSVSKQTLTVMSRSEIGTAESIAMLFQGNGKLSEKLNKRLRRFYFPRGANFHLWFGIQPSRYFPLLGVLSSKRFLEISEEELLREMRMDEFGTKALCATFETALPALIKAGYPGFTGWPGGESGKIGGESGKIALPTFPCLGLGRNP
ncbi:MAG: hypothetical protein K2X47_05220 [Bdellovibrionales bacterium]|nr:hypothetical protein [Bdellovibrionales bacterium]